MRRSLIAAALTVALAIGLCWYVLRSTVGSPPVVPAVAAPATPVPALAHPGWLRCDALTAAPPSDSAVAAIEAELYRAILAQAPHPDAIDAIVVEAASSPIPRMRPDGGWTPPWPASVEQLARAGEPRCFAQTTDRFPAGAHLVAADQIQGPRALATMFRGARQSFAFSRALFDSDHLDAVAYYDRFCYVGCGVGEWVWFHRDHPGEPWRIAGTRPRWMT